MARSEIRCIGYGGQGVITLSKMIAYAAVVDNKEAVQTEAYGPASRGGSCWAEVVVDDERAIDYPRAILPQFQPGAVIPVKVDAEDPQQVVIDWSGARAMT